MVLLAAAAPAWGEPPLDPETEVRTLMRQGMELARGVLLGGSGLRPYALVLRPDGGVQRLVPRLAENPPPSDELLAALEANLREKASAGQLRGSAVFVDVVVAHEGAEKEALQARLEHESGFCIDVFHLYSRSPEGAVVFGRTLARARRGTVFANCAPERGRAPGSGAGYPPGAEEGGAGDP